jgi:hypothetical protein
MNAPARTARVTIALAKSAPATTAAIRGATIGVSVLRVRTITA